MDYKLIDLANNWDIVNIKEMTNETDRVKVKCEVLSMTDHKPQPLTLYLIK
jgi:hypothetical protein